jgi:hypothetical protein
VVDNAPLIKKTTFPRILLPLSVVLSQVDPDRDPVAALRRLRRCSSACRRRGPGCGCPLIFLIEFVLPASAYRCSARR